MSPPIGKTRHSIKIKINIAKNKFNPKKSEKAKITQELKAIRPILWIMSELLLIWMDIYIFKSKVEND